MVKKQKIKIKKEKEKPKKTTRLCKSCKKNLVKIPKNFCETCELKHKCSELLKVIDGQSEDIGTLNKRVSKLQGVILQMEKRKKELGTPEELNGEINRLIEKNNDLMNQVARQKIIETNLRDSIERLNKKNPTQKYNYSYVGKQKCIICSKPVVHRDRKYKICLDCLIVELIQIDTTGQLYKIFKNKK